jgi:hypothetical protein
VNVPALILVMAIWCAEGGDRTRFPYGIKSVRTDDPRQVCLNTVCNQWERWNGTGCFIDSLADRYCPPGVDPVGNARWKRNVKVMVGHNVCRCAKTVERLERPAAFPPTSEYRSRLRDWRRKL